MVQRNGRGLFARWRLITGVVVVALIATLVYIGRQGAASANLREVSILDAPNEIALLHGIADWRSSREPLSLRAIDTWRKLPEYSRSFSISGGEGRYLFEGEPDETLDAVTPVDTHAGIVFGADGQPSILSGWKSLIPFPRDDSIASSAGAREASYAGNFSSDGLAVGSGANANQATSVKSWSRSAAIKTPRAPTHVLSSRAVLVDAYSNTWMSLPAASPSRPRAGLAHVVSVAPAAGQEAVTGGAPAPEVQLVADVQPAAAEETEPPFRYVKEAGPQKKAVLWAEEKDANTDIYYVQNVATGALIGPYDVAADIAALCVSASEKPATGEEQPDAAAPEAPCTDCSAEGVQTDEANSKACNEDPIYYYDLNFALSPGGRYFAAMHDPTGRLVVYDANAVGAPLRTLILNDMPGVGDLAKPDVASGHSLALSENGRFVALSLKAMDRDGSGSFRPLGMLAFDFEAQDFDFILLQDQLKNATGFVPPLSDAVFTPDNRSIVMTQSFTLSGRAVNKIIEYDPVLKTLQTVYSGDQLIKRVDVYQNFIGAGIGSEYVMWERRTGSFADREEQLRIRLPGNVFDVAADERNGEFYVVSGDFAPQKNMVAARLGSWPSRYRVDVFKLKSHEVTSSANLMEVYRFQSDSGNHFDMSEDGESLAALVTTLRTDKRRDELGGEADSSMGILFTDRSADGARYVEIPDKNLGSRYGRLFSVFFEKGSQSVLAVGETGVRVRVGARPGADTSVDVLSPLQSPGRGMSISDLRRTPDRAYLFGEAAYQSDSGFASCVCVWKAEDGTLVGQKEAEEFYSSRSNYDFDPTSQTIVTVEDTHIVGLTPVLREGDMISLKLSEEEAAEGISVMPGGGAAAVFVSHRAKDGRVRFAARTFDIGDEAGADGGQFSNPIFLNENGHIFNSFDYRDLPQISDIAWSDDGRSLALAITDLVTYRDGVNVYEVRKNKPTRLEKLFKKNLDDRPPLRIDRRASSVLTNVADDVIRQVMFAPNNPTNANVIVSGDPVTRPKSVIWDAGEIAEDSCRKLRYLADKDQPYYADGDLHYLDACGGVFQKIVRTLELNFSAP